MATVVKRTLRATPHRTAAQVWQLITKLIAPDAGSAARSELSRVAGVFGQLIGGETFRDHPIIVHGNGPRVRLYCLYGEEAITGDDANENAFQTAPTDGDWAMSVPCLDADLAWAKKEFAARSTRITARDLDEDVPEQQSASSQTQQATVDTDAFFRS